MAKKKLTARSRFTFSMGKLWNALRWMLVSGVATYVLMELSKYVQGLKLATEHSALVLLVINTLLFAIAKFVEGEDK